jgi:hypothetical protein
MIVGFTIAKVEGPPNHCDCAAEKANTSSDSKVVMMCIHSVRFSCAYD